MKFGIVPINLREFTNSEYVIPFVQKAEKLGYESVWTAEHVIIPQTYESVYPYNPSGKLPFKPHEPIIDPLVALTYVAASTTTMRLGTGVNILPQINPLYLAKWGGQHRPFVARTADAGRGGGLAARRVRGHWRAVCAARQACR